MYDESTIKKHIYILPTSKSVYNTLSSVESAQINIHWNTHKFKLKIFAHFLLNVCPQISAEGVFGIAVLWCGIAGNAEWPGRLLPPPLAPSPSPPLPLLLMLNGCFVCARECRTETADIFHRHANVV